MDLLDRIKESVFIIGEIGNNHNGKLETAIKLIDIAAEANVDAVKFQTFRGIDIVTPKVKADAYKGWSPKGFTYWYEFLDSIALPLEDHKEVFEYAKSKLIIPFSTPTSTEIVDFLEGLDVELYKIASMDITNVKLLKKVASTGKPVIFSTGMSTEEEIDKAVNIFKNNQTVILHCISDYPTKISDANLLSIQYLKERFRSGIGFSDHTLSHDLAALAVAAGARVIEKHMTYDRNAPEVAEHHVSLEPEELKALVKAVRNAELALGSFKLCRSAAEEETRQKSRRSLHVNRSMSAGEVLSDNDISILRPNDGAQPEDYELFVGKPLKNNLEAWSPLTMEDIV